MTGDFGNSCVTSATSNRKTKLPTTTKTVTASIISDSEDDERSMTEPINEKNGVDDGQKNQNDGLCIRLLPKSRRHNLLGSLLLVVMLVTFGKEWRNLSSLDFHYHDDQYNNMAKGQQYDDDDVAPSNKSKVAYNSASSSSSRPTNYLMYVMTLQGVEGAGNTNDGRYDQFQRHWKILCNHHRHDDNSQEERIHFHKCPGHLNPKGSSAGFGLSMAFLDCFRWTLKHHKEWHQENNPNATVGLDGDNIPFIFLEDDARLYNSNFCYSEYRNRLWKSLPQTNATLLLLGGHDMGFYDTNHPIARSYQDHFYNESILMDPSVLPQFIRPRRGFGSYGFALLNTPTVEYMTRKMDKMLNRTFDSTGMRGFKAIDQQFHHYGVLKTVMSYPWLVYHEGGLYSNTKGKVRGEYGDGSKQYRWIDGLTGSTKNCTSSEYDTEPGNKNQANATSGLSKTDDFHEATVNVSCRKVTFRIPNSFSWKNNSTFAAKKIIIAIVSRSNNSGMRASIRSTWGKLSGYRLFLVAGPWKEIVSEFQEHGDLVWVNLPEDDNSGSNTDSSIMLSTLQVASFLMLAETHYGDHYSHILKLTDHSYANLGAIRSQLVDKDQENVAMWGSHCGTGVRPSHVGVPETEYSDYYFPQYCKGEGYALSKFFVRCAVGQIPHSRLVSLDDAYIGILGERCGLQENQFHSGADVETGKISLLQHGLETPDAMEEYHSQWLNATSDSRYR